jgi:hypothetical protein
MYKDQCLIDSYFLGIDVGLTTDEVEKQLQNFCMESLKSLSETGMIKLDEHDQFDVKPTENGQQMARYCVPFETMKDFVHITGTETLMEMVGFGKNFFRSEYLLYISEVPGSGPITPDLTGATCFLNLA